MASISFALTIIAICSALFSALFWVLSARAKLPPANYLVDTEGELVKEVEVTNYRDWHIAVSTRNSIAASFAAVSAICFAIIEIIQLIE